MHSACQKYVIPILCSYAIVMVVCFKFELHWNNFLIPFAFCFVPILGVFEEVHFVCNLVISSRITHLTLGMLTLAS